MRKKRIGSFLLGLILVFGMFPSAFAESVTVHSIDRSHIQKAGIISQRAIESTIPFQPEEAGLSDNDLVRLIVELKEKPIIEYATEKGISLSDMEPNSLKELTDQLLSSQKRIQTQIAARNINAEYHYNFIHVFNGFSLTTAYANLKEIEKIDGVKRVTIANEYDRPEPDMRTSNGIVKAPQTWDLGYNGEGMVIAILDTGIDPTHKDMVLTNPNEAKYDRTSMESLIRDRGLPGRFYTVKVPYGYNYYDKNDTILDLGPGATMHGMHVAGIAGANGDETGIKGVAPEAQLLAMKVFGNDPEMRSTFGDIIIRAIDDSVKLGADVINMSLGSTAAFVKPEDPEQQAVTRAAQNGVFLSVSAGNSSHIGYGYSNPYLGGEYPYEMNPDIGVVGSPGLTAETIQVASLENTHMLVNTIDYEGTDGTAGYLPASDGPDPIEVFQREPVPFEYAGFGSMAEIPDDIAGKIALIQRGISPIDGTANFVDKISNAQRKGASGVIIFNNPRPDEEVLVNMAYPADGRIPAVSVGRRVGLALLDLEQKVVAFTGNTTNLENPNAGRMSAFSSWGVTPNLDFKPEITAPGGQIYSTLNDNKYGVMSGTSMAAPHVSGGAALILQRIHEEFPELSGKAIVDMAKNLLMNTAHPHINRDGLLGSNQIAFNPTSPRKQGAGIMDLYAAATTPAILTDARTGISKVALKEIGTITTFPIQVTNFSDEELSYNVSAFAGTDFLYGPVIGGVNLGLQNRLEMVEVVDQNTGQSPVIFRLQDGTEVNAIHVPPHSSLTLSVTLDLTDAVDQFYGMPLTSLFDHGTFVEGFIYLEPTNDEIPQLNIPYIGFYGDWNEAPIIDISMLDNESNAIPYYGYTVLTWPDEEAGLYQILGVDYNGESGDMNLASFAPNGNGFYDKVQPLVSFLRNAKEFKIKITDQTGKVLRTLATEKEIRKDYYNSGGSGSSRFRTDADWAWDGKIRNKIAADGLYYFQFESRIDDPEGDWQIYRLPIRVDTLPPVIVDFNYDVNLKQLTVTADDGEYPVYAYALMENGILLAQQQDGLFDLTQFPDLFTGTHVLTVRVFDYAGNFVDSDPLTLGDGQMPFVIMTSPEPLQLFNTGELEASGYVVSNGLAELRINGENIPFTYNEESGNYNFATVLHYESGVHEIDVTARGTSGLSSNFKRKIFVDLEAPLIQMTAEPPSTVDANVDHIDIAAEVADNFGELRVKVSGDEVYYKEGSWEYINEPDPTTYTLEPYSVELDYGMNIVTVEAYDGAGNSTILTYEVYRKLADDPSSVTITAQPSANEIAVNAPFTVGINFSPAADLYAAQFSLTYDEALVKGTVEPSPEILAYLNEQGASDQYFVNERVVDLGNGKRRSDYIITILGDLSGYTGSGSLAIFSFSSSTTGDFDFEISNARMLNSNGVDIEIGEMIPGTIHVREGGGPTEYIISGNIVAEAFGPDVDYSMTWYSGEDGVHRVVIEAVNEEGEVAAVGTVNADGSYALKVAEAGSYTIRVVVPGHFGAEIPVDVDDHETVNFGPLTAGDVNGDEVIDLKDLQQAARAFGKTAPWSDARSSAADLNRDGEIDLADISFIINNYGLRR